jgi:hypothetical protein
MLSSMGVDASTDMSSNKRNLLARMYLQSGTERQSWETKLQLVLCFLGMWRVGWE